MVLYRLEGCSSSALKGLYFHNASETESELSGFLISLGYDQRLTIWNVNIDLSQIKNNLSVGAFIHSKPLNWRNLETIVSPIKFTWVTGKLVNIGDIQSLKLIKNSSNEKENHFELVGTVIGEGFQLVNILV